MDQVDEVDKVDKGDGKRGTLSGGGTGAMIRSAGERFWENVSCFCIAYSWGCW